MGECLKTAVRIAKGVTVFGENIHLEKFHPYGGPTTNPHCYHFCRTRCKTLTSSEVAPNISVFVVFGFWLCDPMTSNSGAVLPRLILFIFNMYLITTSGQK